jgi:hypothetical protein
MRGFSDIRLQATIRGNLFSVERPYLSGFMPVDLALKPWHEIDLAEPINCEDAILRETGIDPSRLSFQLYEIETGRVNVINNNEASLPEFCPCVALWDEAQPDSVALVDGADRLRSAQEKGYSTVRVYLPTRD